MVRIWMNATEDDALYMPLQSSPEHMQSVLSWRMRCSRGRHGLDQTTWNSFIRGRRRRLGMSSRHAYPVSPFQKAPSEPRPERTTQADRTKSTTGHPRALDAGRAAPATMQPPQLMPRPGVCGALRTPRLRGTSPRGPSRRDMEGRAFGNHATRDALCRSRCIGTVSSLRHCG